MIKILYSLEHFYYQLILFIFNLKIYLRYPSLFFINTIITYYYYFCYSHKKNHQEKQNIKIISEELTYGETSYYAIEQAFKYIKYQQNHIFYDLGSGMGKLVFFIHKRYKLKTIGIEIMPTFYKLSHAIASIKKSSNIQFFHQDFNNYNFSNANIIFLAGTCLSYPTQQKLILKLEKLQQGAYIITTSYPIKSKHFQPIAKIPTLFSWGKSALYIQQKT